MPWWIAWPDRTNVCRSSPRSDGMQGFRWSERSPATIRDPDTGWHRWYVHDVRLPVENVCTRTSRYERICFVEFRFRKRRRAPSPGYSATCLKVEFDVRAMQELRGPPHPTHGLFGDALRPFGIVSSRRVRRVTTHVPQANGIGATGRNRKARGHSTTIHGCFHLDVEVFGTMPSFVASTRGVLFVVFSRICRSVSIAGRGLGGEETISRHRGFVPEGPPEATGKGTPFLLRLCR
mmetsp:Transcript_3678/g.23055  ORF Transcript_3678/g.23055 Transcript_3678/m.23055 type:complete len:235 (+) Transcript_3678:142-846(+)